MKGKRHIQSFGLFKENLNISDVSESSFSFNDEKLKRMMLDLVDYTRGMLKAVPKDTESKKFVDNFIKEYEDWYKEN